MHVLSTDHRAVTYDLVTGLRAAGAALVVVPEVTGIDWRAVMANSSQSIVITNRPSQALRLCLQGQPAIAVMGASEPAIAKWLRARGANAKNKAGAH